MKAIRITKELREAERLLRIAVKALRLAENGDTSQNCSPGNRGIVVAAMDAIAEINTYGFLTSGPLPSDQPIAPSEVPGACSWREAVGSTLPPSPDPVTEAAREIGNALDLAYNKEAAISAIIRRTVQEPMERELAHERADRMDAEKWNQTHIDECQNLRTQLATLGITRPKE